MIYDSVRRKVKSKQVRLILYNDFRSFFEYFILPYLAADYGLTRLKP